jgi:hydroxymethylpyrimidine pyrophosphatase-like HAD family hydrolase
MRYVCLTCDYDGTIARNGAVAASTLQALEKVRASGRQLILATGRELQDLLNVFPDIAVFDRVVAENGGILYRPASKELIVLGEKPPPQFVDALRKRGVDPLSVGECVVATWHPHETAALEVIREMNLELQIIFNKNAVMILPSGVNKSSGLSVALNELHLSPHNVVGVGDAENDHAFLGLCECSVAVANAFPALKNRCDWVTAHSHGAGVEELIALLLKDDLQELAPKLERHNILLGSSEKGGPVSVPAYGGRLLVSGPSGSGKSTTVSALVERLFVDGYQVCLFDPEGDYDEFDRLVTLGGPDRIPGASEVLEILENPGHSITVNMLGVSLSDRPAFFQTVLARVLELRFKTGRPHWIVIDEAHHVLPKDLGSAASTIPLDLENFILVTVHPDMVAPAILNLVREIIAVGPEPQSVISQLYKGTKNKRFLAPLPPAPGNPGESLVWPFANSAAPCYVRVEPGRSQHRRHRRKYASGELGEDKSFYFRGPEGKLHLRAQNMNLFAQIAEGVDESTWSFHLFHGDYSRWFRDSIKDDEIAAFVASIEQNSALGPAESRLQIIDAIRKHYTAPA